MPSDNYPYAVGRIKIIENSLLGEAKLSRLRELSARDAVRQLSEWGYASDYPVKTDVDALIAWRQREIRELVAELTPDPCLTELFWLDRDAVNLKYLLKARLLGGVEAEGIELEQGVYSVDLLRDSVASKNYSQLPAFLCERLSQLELELKASPDPRMLSVLVDRAFFAMIFSVLGKKRNVFCERYFSSKADLVNVTSVLRARALGWNSEMLRDMLIDGGELPFEPLLAAVESDEPQKHFAGFAMSELIEAGISASARSGIPAASKLFDEKLLSLAAEERFDPFGIGPIAYFILRADSEARDLRVIFAKKQSVVTAAQQ